MPECKNCSEPFEQKNDEIFCPCCVEWNKINSEECDHTKKKEMMKRLGVLKHVCPHCGETVMAEFKQEMKEGDE